MVYVLFAVGLILLVAGADVLVRGAGRLAVSAGISPLVVGLTVVAFGTSAPEMAVSAQSALGGNGGIAVGNVIGSNICNVLLILGLSAAITPLVVAQKLIRVDTPLVIAATVIAWLLVMDGTLGFWDGLLLCGGIIVYTVFAVMQSRRETRAVRTQYEREVGSRLHGVKGYVVDVLLIAAGLGLLVQGSDWLVDGATAMARAFGVDDMLVGLTIVAVGTSLPELATSVIASIKGERDIAVGNVIGSNLFNILAVLGFCGLLAPGGVAISPSMILVDFPIMLAVVVACLPVFFTGHLIARWEGFVFLGYYLAYTAFLILTATEHGSGATFRSAMMFFVIPLTLLTLGVSLGRSLKAPRVRT